MLHHTASATPIVGGELTDDIIDVADTQPQATSSVSSAPRFAQDADLSTWEAVTAEMVDDVLPPGISHYDDFQTIDWQRDLARDRMRHRYIVKKKELSKCEWIKAVIDAASGWLCVLLVGMLAGLLAGMMDIGTVWMSDLKDGVCEKAPYFSREHEREHCCWASNTTNEADDECNEWRTWSGLVAGHELADSALAYFVQYLFYTLLGVTFAGLSAMLVRQFAPYACGAGIAEIKCILSGFIMRGFMGKWTLVIKSISLMLSVASGLSLGKEGPMVHLGCCIGNIVAYLFPKYGKNEAKKREILSASCAAGISVAFGAPIGGVLFSLEEASYYFPLKTLWRSFFCALIAGLFLRLINPFGSDQTSLFAVDYTLKWSYTELLAFMALGVFGGLVGTFFIKVNIWWCGFRKRSWLGRYPIGEVLAMALLTSLVCFPNPYTRQSSTQLIKRLFDRCRFEDRSELCNYTYNETFVSSGSGGGFNAEDSGRISGFGSGVWSASWKLFLAMVVKLFLTTFTIGMKVPAGLFIPSKAIGAAAGRIVGIGMQWLSMNFKNDAVWTVAVQPGLYAVVGAAAVVGGVTRMTVSLVVIMFELTGSLDCIVPTMAAVMFAKWVGDSLCREGICDAQIVLNQYPFLDNKEEFQHLTVAADVMHPRPGEAPLRVLTQDTMTLRDIDELFVDTHHNGFPVVVSAESQYVVGFVSRRDLSLAINNALATRRVAMDTPVLFTEAGDCTAATIGSRANSLAAESSPVTPNAPPRPLRLRKLLDLAPITITDQTPMETVIDMFRKLGLRQTLVIHNGRLLGIITKKDVLRHVAEMDAHERSALELRLSS